MDDNNLAIVLILILITLVIIFAAYFARKWITSFYQAMRQAKDAERGGDNNTAVDA